MGGCYNLSRRSGRGWISCWKIWTEGCEKHWMSGEKHHLQHEGYTFNLRYSAGWNINGALRSFFAKRRSRIRPSILRPAPPEWIKVLLAHRLHSLGVGFTTTRAIEFAFSMPQLSGCTKTSEVSSDSVLCMQTIEHRILE